MSYQRITTNYSSMCDSCEGISSCHKDCYNRLLEKQLISLEDAIEQSKLVDAEEFKQKIARDVLKKVCTYLDSTFIGTGARARIVHSIQHGVAMDYNIDLTEIL